MSPEFIPSINRSLEIQLPETISAEELQKRLTEYFNHLIQADFPKLISILYRLDISETRLKQMLKETPNQYAGQIIAGLVIERQRQKAETRKQYHKPDSADTDPEKW
jgi:hypothetical protein